MKFRYFFITFLFLSLCSNAFSFDHSHKGFDSILNGFVKFRGKQSFFNYKKLKKDSRTLDIYLKEVSSVSKKSFNSFSRDERLAFLINAYNAFTIKIILKNHPLKSIKDIGSLFTSTWKKKFFTLLEEKSHLDNIEHNLIRKNFNEPRIHFAVNCASIGCPSLQKEAFTARNLETLLESATINFLTNRAKNHFKNGEIKISKLFKWYGEDFEKKNGSVEKFIGKYLTRNKKEQISIEQGRVKKVWTKYDWKLNELGDKYE